MNYLSIRDLQKLSSAKIAKLERSTPIKCGDRTIAFLMPLKKPNMKRLNAALARAEELARHRDPKEDEAALKRMGIDTTIWDDEAVRKVEEEHRKLNQKRRKR